MAVGAPYGNRNAEKWNIKKAVMLFNDAIDLTNKKESQQVKVGDKVTEFEGYSYDFIGELAGELGTFKEIFSHLVKRFNVLSRKHKQLITNIERNCYYNGKKGAIKEASAIMNLKSNHKWTDRIEQNQNINDERKSVNDLFPTDDELKED